MSKEIIEKYKKLIKESEENIELFKETIKYLELKQNSKKIQINDFEETFFITNANCDSRIVRIPESNGEKGYWILKAGSRTNAPAFWNEFGSNGKMNYGKFWQKHIENIDLSTGVVEEDIKDTSISNLVAISNGRISSSGWSEVKNKEGKTACELYRA